MAIVEAQPIYKGDIIESAMRRAQLSGSLFNPDMFTLQSAGSILEEWALSVSALGCPLGWLKSEDGFNPSGDEDSGISDWMMKGVSCSLAIELCEAVGVPVPAMLIKSAEDGMKPVWANVEVYQPTSFNMPLGSAQGYREFSSETNSNILEESQERFLGNLEV